jgi:hypothetical protein
MGRGSPATGGCSALPVLEGNMSKLTAKIELAHEEWVEA